MFNKITFLLLMGWVFSAQLGMAQCTEPFFSEYIEGSSNNKALEIYNPSDVAIDLTNYTIYRYGNGSPTPTDTFELSGMLAAGGVHVSANSSADSIILSVADDSLGFPGVITFNGDDAMGLLNESTGMLVDVIGEIGNDPGSSWPVDTGSTANFTLVRMPSINEGTTDWTVGATQWIVLPINTFDSLGAHNMNPCSVTGGGSGCTTDLFFSEYIEGSSNNKALEIYNPMDVDVDLTNYTIYRYGNGSPTPTDTFELSGMLAAGGVHISANSSADSIILSVADDSLGFPGVITFNGDDAMGLLNESTGMLVDVIGEIGNDPGSSWPVDTGSTANFTLVRMPSINEGTTDWTVGATQWIVLPINTFDSLGAHNMNPCSVTGGGSGCTTDLFFSEYIEGSSNNKALEIYNPMDVDVDLTNYTIYRYGNGSPTPTDTFELSGMLAAGGVHISANSSADSIILSVADDSLGFPGVITFNGDDAMGLLNESTGMLVDVIGEIGNDPGSSWPVGTGSTANFTLVRMPSINEGTTDWTVGATQWIVLPINTFDSLGTHTMNPCTTSGGTGCTTDIFFSEYIEGSSNNKALEIYNPGDTTVDLTNYTIYRYGNGSPTPTDTFELSGTLASQAVHISANSSADSIILSVANDSLGFPGVITFNGDDAMGLLNESTGMLVDVIGEIGTDPGSNWPVGTGSTANFTLVRMASINEGTTDWNIGATQWDVFPQDVFDSLGAHYMIPCNAPAPDSATVSFVPAMANVSEGAGTATLSISLLDGGMDTVAVDVMLDAGASTATLGTDFTWSDTTIVFPANATNPITLDVILTDDSDIEMDETIVVNLVNATNGAKIGAGTFTLTIQDNDYVQYPIGLVTNDSDGDGLGDSLGVRCQVQGIVHGIDLQGGSSVQFTMIDSTGGITIFSGNDFGYTVVEGDEVLVQGTITHFNGLTQFSPPDNIILLSQGNPTVTPRVVTTLDETTESELVTLECVTLIDTSQWPTSGGSINIDVFNGVDTFEVRIDSDVDLNGTPVPAAKWLNITGLGGQFDDTDPRTEGYQLLPRYMADVVERGAPTVTFAAGTASVDESAGTFDADVYQADGNPDATMVTVVLDSSSTATLGTDFTWSDTTVVLTGCGADSVSLPIAITDDSDIEGDETIVLIITTVTNDASVMTDTMVVTITETDAIDNLLPVNAIRLYPNPAKDVIFWNSDYRIETLVISNLVGQELVRRVNPEANSSMNISSLPNGVYLIRVETREGLWIQKWIKE